jgi:hypothetical protein
MGWSGFNAQQGKWWLSAPQRPLYPPSYTIFINSHSGGVESQLGPLDTSATSGLLYLLRVILRIENLVEWRLEGENRSTRRKPAPAPLSPPQIPLDQTRPRSRPAAVGSQRLTSWAMERPSYTKEIDLFPEDKVAGAESSHSHVARYACYGMVLT